MVSEENVIVVMFSPRTTGIAFFAECLRHSAKAILHSASVKNHSAKKNNQQIKNGKNKKTAKTSF
jgi:hypothetical protein